MLIKKIRITLDRTTWPQSSPVPGLFKPFLGDRDIDVDAALILTALITRPPVIRGFSLADTWAWFRYRAAFSGAPWLQLRGEWDELDPHQKTILSDELGVGFTTHLRCLDMGFVAFTDTRYVMRLLDPTGAWLASGRTKKRGPDKLPDYIGFLPSQLLGVLECKGSQSSVEALLRSMVAGVKQKKNIAPPQSVLSLVGGLYVPQSFSTTSATVHFIDPPRRVSTRLDGLDPISVRVAILQIFYAQHFALMGLPALAQQLAAGPTSPRIALSVDFGVLRDLIDSDGYLRFNLDYPLPLEDSDSLRATHIRLSASYHSDELRSLMQPGQLTERLLRLSHNPETMTWALRQLPELTEIKTPLGFTFGLQLVRQQPRR